MATKLLIVDDEKFIRLGLLKMIEREFQGQYELFTATQGAEALQLYLTDGADIIITDIRMPVMDGITLIERISSKVASMPSQSGPLVIILSGYEDFEYAKAAIRYNAQDYLLKPIRRDELFEALHKCNEQLAKRTQMVERIAVAENYRLQELLLQQELSEQDIQKWSEEIGFERYMLPFSVAVLSYKYEDGSRMKKEELKSFAEHMFKSVAGHLNASFLDSEGRVVLIGGPHSKFVELSHLADDKELGGLLIGLSHEGDVLTDLITCYKQASEALSYTLIYPKTRLINFNELSIKKPSYTEPREAIHKLGNVLGTNREKEISLLLHEIFRVDQLPDINIHYLEATSKLINHQVLDEVFRIYGEASIDVLKLYRKVGDISNFRHFHDYFRSLEQLLFKLDEYIKEVRSAHIDHGDMKNAVAYIEENYHRPLNMAIVSNHVSLNYSYFSEMFKEHTGENFVSYLKKVRIRKAKELIGTGSHNLSDISTAVGFVNSRQFSKVFREVEGITPFEYRGKLIAGKS